MDILRFITAGNVDDGKSTLIGRLLYDTHNIKDDVLESVTEEKGKGSNVNLAHITDGLRAEREQGITIDVAYKYFTTKNRKYIISDAPGHAQYTRNVVTGASNADVMIILIDAQLGITEQTRRHSLVASFLKISQVVVAINKMDLVGYDERVFTAIKNDFLQIADKLQLRNATVIPISALLGDNVSFPSKQMNWYSGKTLEQYLESCAPMGVQSSAARFSVQYIINRTEKGYAGKILSGTMKVGDKVVIYPGEDRGVVKKIICGYDEVHEAKTGENICLFLDTAVEVVRGNLLTHTDDSPHCNDQFEATVCWLDAVSPMQTGIEYFLRINAAAASCIITEVINKTDISSFEKYTDDKPVAVNEFAKVRIKTNGKVAYDLFADIPGNGRGILIDPATNYTSGAFVIEK